MCAEQTVSKDVFVDIVSFLQKNKDEFRMFASHLRVCALCVLIPVEAFLFDLRSAQVYCVAIFLVSQEVSLNFHRFCG